MAQSGRASDRPMAQRWRLALFLVLVFPVVGFAVGAGVQVKYQGDLIAAVEQEVGRTLTAEERGRVTIDVLCADPQFAGDPVCQDVALATITRWVALGSGIGGLLLLGFIASTTRRARGDRDALLRLFLPSLYVTLVGVSVLLVADALLALSSVYLGFGVFLGRIVPVLLLAIAIGGALGVAGMIRALIGTTRRATSFVIARRVDRIDEPDLHALVGEIASAAGTTVPDNVIVGLDPSFFVTEADVISTDGRWRGRNIYLSLPLMRILTPAELRAVVGHEMGHFRGSDTVYSQRFYPIYRGAGDAIAGLAGAGAGSGARTLALLPAAVLLVLFYEGFATAERAISRDRELAADAVGAEIASARDLASSLVKLTAFTPRWEGALESFAKDWRGGTVIPNLGDRFVELVRTSATPEALEGLDARELPHPTDSHPALSQRLEALGIAEAEVASAALQVAPEPPAGAVIAGRSADEEALTAWIAARIGGAGARAAKAEAAAG